MQRAVHNHRGDVYDPFVGSGTTVIAGEQEGRRVYGIEIDPAVGGLHRQESPTEAVTAWRGKIAPFHDTPLGSARRPPGRFRPGRLGKSSAFLCAGCRP